MRFHNEVVRQALDLAKQETRELGEAVSLAQSWKQEAEYLREVIRKHYPTIAGHVLRLQEGHEDRAAEEWLAVARDFAHALAQDVDSS